MTGGSFDSGDLESLLEAAVRADPSTRVPEYRDAIARFGSEAIPAVGRLADHGQVRRFAVTVIERAGSAFGARREAITELRRIHRTTDDVEFQSFVASALQRLGFRVQAAQPRNPQPPVEVPEGYSVAPPFADKHHVVVDYVAESGTGWGDIYLFACRRFFSGSWVRRNGGLQSPEGLRLCYGCSNAVERGV
jgi:hypothetical protein